MATPPSQNLGCLLSFLRLFGIGGGSPAPANLPYRQRDDFLSAAEMAFYQVLLRVVGDRAVICPKVRVADLVFVVGGEGRTSAQNRINAKHVDFVLCRPGDMRPIAALELDDRSHNRPDRADRDDFLDQVFVAAGLPLVRVPARRGYELAELAALVEPCLSPPAAANMGIPPVLGPGVAEPPARSTATPPSCPKCGIAMVVRTASRGNSAGQKFYGCTNYPRCREVVQMR